MTKVTLVPSDKYFKENVSQLYRNSRVSFIAVLVDGCAVTCDNVRILPNGWFAYSSKAGLGELRVTLDRVQHIIYYLEV